MIPSFICAQGRNFHAALRGDSTKNKFVFQNTNLCFKKANLCLCLNCTYLATKRTPRVRHQTLSCGLSLKSCAWLLSFGVFACLFWCVLFVCFGVVAACFSLFVCFREAGCLWLLSVWFGVDVCVVFLFEIVCMVVVVFWCFRLFVLVRFVCLFWRGCCLFFFVCLVWRRGCLCGRFVCLSSLVCFGVVVCVCLCLWFVFVWLF